MATIKDQVKQIAREVITANGTPSKYRLGTIVSMNDDGTCNVMIDGNSIQANPLIPVVQGQQAAVIYGTGGQISVVPTRPNTDPVVFEKPPFFTGGGLKLAWPERIGTFANPTAHAIRFQQVGSSQVFRYQIPVGTATLKYLNPVIFGYSPNGQYFAYACGGMTYTGPPAVTPGIQTKIAVLKIGSSFGAGAPIAGFPNGFLLNNATETVALFPAGFDIATAFLTVNGPLNTGVTIHYEVSSIFVTNAGQPYWTEDVFLQFAVDQVTSAVYHTNGCFFCTAIGGVRTVLGSIVSSKWDTGTGAYQPPGTSGYGGEIVPLGSPGTYFVQLGALLFDPVNDADPTHPRAYAMAFHPKSFPANPANIDQATHTIADIFPFNQIYGNATTPTDVQTYDDGSTSNTSSAGQGSAFPSYASSHTSWSFYFRNVHGILIFTQIKESRQTGAIVRYTIITNNLRYSRMFFGENNTTRGAVCDDPNLNGGTVLRKVTVDDVALTITLQTPLPNNADLYTVSPNNPDAGRTTFNPRDVVYDSYTVLPPTLPGSSPIVLGGFFYPSAVVFSQ